MASNQVLSAILHYKRNIDKVSDPPERALRHEDRLLHCINKLYRLPVNINHLQETGIGKTVNSLRKIEGEKGLGDAAKALVAKWKTMVMLQDEADRKERELPPSTSTEEDIRKIQLIRDAEKSQALKTDESNSGRREHRDKSKHKKERKRSKSESLHSGEEGKRSKTESVHNGEERKRSKPESLHNGEERKRSKIETLHNGEEKKRSKAESLHNGEERKRSKLEFIHDSEEKKRIKSELVHNSEEKRRSKSETVHNSEEKKRSKPESLHNGEEKKRSKAELVHNSEEKRRSKSESVHNSEEKKRSKLESVHIIEEKKRSKCESVHNEEERMRSKPDSVHSEKERRRKHSDEGRSGNGDDDGSRNHSKSKKRSPNPYEADNAEDIVAQTDKYSQRYDETKSMNSTTKKKEKDRSGGDKNECSAAKSDKKHESKTNPYGSSSKPKPKKPEVDHIKREKSEAKSSALDQDSEGEGGIDCHSGASFADALGPMIVKKPKKKFSHTVSVTQADVSGATKFTKEKKQNKQIDISRPPTEPLEPDMMATLPIPTPNYKPSPTLNLPLQEASRKRMQAEEDALKTMMSNKNQRTKVYSGVKGGLTHVPTLYEFCCRVLQQHLDAIEYTGGIPYSLLKPILDAATPGQLFQFEHFNPYIIEDTDHLWKFHVNKEFRNNSRQEFESWRDMYLRCIDEREEKYKAVTANIQKSIEQSAPVRKAKLAYIDVAKPPRNILRKQIKNGTSKPAASRLLGRDNPEAVRVAPPKQSSSREPLPFKVKPKVAPLMQKTLKSIKMTRFKR